MSKYKLPQSLSLKVKDRLLLAKELFLENGPFVLKDFCELIFPNPSKIDRADVSATLTQLRVKGWLSNHDGFWTFTKEGEYVVENIDSVPIRASPSTTKSPAKKQPEVKSKAFKKPINEIQPIQKQFTPNLSDSATNLANSLGAVLDDNQAYRDAMKEMLNTLANFLGATIIYEGDKENGSSTNKE